MFISERSTSGIVAGMITSPVATTLVVPKRRTNSSLAMAPNIDSLVKTRFEEVPAL